MKSVVLIHLHTPTLPWKNGKEMSKSVWNSGTEKMQEFSFRKLWHSIEVASSDLCTGYFPMIAISARCKPCDVAIMTAIPPQWQMVLLRAVPEKHGGQADFQRDEYCGWLVVAARARRHTAPAPTDVPTAMNSTRDFHIINVLSVTWIPCVFPHKEHSGL